MARARRSVPRGGDELDRAHMRRCLELAERFRGRTSPNPIVGSVIVSARGEVLAEGAHAGPGRDHAEVAALKQLGGRAPGATLYVNLEPCNHWGRTPPCAPAVRDAGVARVVIGMLDPISGHGGGAALLRRAGISVTTNVLRDECARANAPFLMLAAAGRPRFTLKAGITLDGKIATVAGESKWITSAAARADSHALRATHDAILVGIGTVLADDPQLTSRAPGARDPVRLVLDAKLRTPASARLLPRPAGAGRAPGRANRRDVAARDAAARDVAARRESAREGAARGEPASARVFIACGPRAPKSAEAALVAAGAEVWRMPLASRGHIDLPALAKALGAAGLSSVLVEGGGEVHASLLAADLADDLVLYMAPLVVGGPARSWVGGTGVAALADAHRFAFDPDVATIGGDLRITATRIAATGVAATAKTAVERGANRRR